MKDLSQYELQRLETIRQNALAMQAMGLQEAIEDVRWKPKISSPSKQRKVRLDPVASRRSSRRLAGDVALDDDLGSASEAETAAVTAYRDPNDVSQLTAAELKSWCNRLREEVLQGPWRRTLTHEQDERLLHANSAWLGPFTEFTARFGGKSEGPISRQNIKSVLKQVMRLVSGAGITSDKRDGVFAEGQPITLGITAEEVDTLRAEAQLWMPQERSPADLIGRSVKGGIVEKRPSKGPIDTSNGWLLNHPLMKIRLYCEHLDEVRETSLEATMTRLMGAAAPKNKGNAPSKLIQIRVVSATAQRGPPLVTLLFSEVFREQF
ncbi:hypothetical protein AB1Y20_014554 [Prymnesium parvum]|uniref:Uncharacterized protein n=1 Tax=Prymnesium parvum TaxID=97485 RepID=A0AB34IB53_PRYPA